MQQIVEGVLYLDKNMTNCILKHRDVYVVTIHERLFTWTGRLIMFSNNSCWLIALETSGTSPFKRHFRRLDIKLDLHPCSQNAVLVNEYIKGSSAMFCGHKRPSEFFKCQNPASTQFICFTQWVYIEVVGHKLSILFIIVV